jgi:hypothetical protein
MLHGHNRNPVSILLLPDAIDAAVSAVASEIPGLPPVEHFRPTRLDLCRDFVSVRDTADTLARLSRQKIPRLRRKIVYDDDAGAVQTLYRIASPRWQVRGYDKGRELAQRAARPSTRHREAVSAWANASSHRLR